MSKECLNRHSKESSIRQPLSTYHQGIIGYFYFFAHPIGYFCFFYMVNWLLLLFLFFVTGKLATFASPVFSHGKLATFSFPGFFINGTLATFTFLVYLHVLGQYYFFMTLATSSPTKKQMALSEICPAQSSKTLCSQNTQ